MYHSIVLSPPMYTKKFQMLVYSNVIQYQWSWSAERSVRASGSFAISMLNLDTVAIMSGFLYPYKLKGIDSQDLR